MITPDALQQMLDKLPGMPVVTYVNSPAAVKALSTICCTSANAVQVVNSLDSDVVLMAPDRNLAQYTAANTSKNIHIWNGFCPIHDRLTPQDVQEAKSAHPEATFMAHPECRQDVLELADTVVSTSGMIRYASESPNSTFIVGTEIGLLHPLKKANPGKEFFPASDKMVCADMKKITLEDVARCLENMEGEVKVPEDIRREAFKAVDRMISLR
jgi:quinolinate synthase